MTFAQPFSEYEVMDRVGAGSMGTVFKARHKKLDRIVALKVLKPSLARDTRYVERLRREARIVASLNHPNIVTGYDLGQEGGYHFFVMEFVEGKSLRELLDEWGMFAEERVLDVAVQITIALDHAFKKGVIHRDIKPANILIDEDNVVKLTDMGLAKGPDNLTITRDGATVGTPQYISPEQARDPQDVDIRSDLYSLGATLYHMCTGQPPFRAETMANVLIKVLQERAPSAAGFNPELSDGLNLIIRKLLSKDRARRYQAPDELLDDLRRVQRAEPPKVEIKDLDTGEEKGSGRRRLVAAVVGLVLLLAVLWTVDRLAREPEVADDTDRQAAAFSRSLRGTLRDLPSLGARIKKLRELRTEHVAELERGILDAEHARLADRLRIEVEVEMRRAEDDLETIFAQLSWNNTERDLNTRIEHRLAERIGLRVPELSGPAVASYRDGLRILAKRLVPLVGEREQRFCRAVDDVKQDVLQKVRERLEMLDFPGADAALQAGVSRFDVLEVGPATEALPESLANYLRTSKAATSQSGEAQLATQEGEIVKEVQGVLDRNLPKFTKLLQAGEPAMALAQLDVFAQDLRGDYPESNFRDKATPWRTANGAIARLRKQLELSLASEQQKQWSRILRHTYEIVLGGDLDKAKTELRYRVRRDDASRSKPHFEVLDHAAAVRRLLLTRLSKSTSRRRITDLRMRRGGSVDVELVRQGERFTLHLPGQKAALPLAMLRVADLVARLPKFGDSLDADLKAGLALWSVLSGDSDVASLLAGGRYETLFRDVLIPLSEDLRPPEEGWLKSYRLLGEVRNAVAKQDWMAARRYLTDLSKDPRMADESRELTRVINAGTEQDALRRRLREATLEGGKFKLVDRALTLTYDLRRTDLGALPAGWQRNPARCVAYHQGDAELGSAQPLAIDSLCAVDRPVRVDLDLVVAAEAAAPRLYFFTLHGASVGIGIRRDGVVVGVPVARGLRASKELSEQVRLALRRSDRDPAYIVPGALHKVTVQARPQGMGKLVVLTVLLDDREVFTGSAIRPTGRGETKIAVTALQPLTVRSMVVAGTVR